MVEESDHVSRDRAREFLCEVVSETVRIRLHRSYRFSQPPEYFVQCNQSDCQYVDENKLPCPLHVGMFAEEIRVAYEARGRRDAKFLGTGLWITSG